jgi:HK97 family phage prohead protease
MEYKAMQSFVKQIEGRDVTGYVAILGNVDDGGDITWRGAFRKTIGEGAKRVRHLWQHDASLPPIAKIKRLEEVGAGKLPGELVQSASGITGALEITRSYLNTPRADEILAGIQAGAITEMSYAYDPIKFDFAEINHPDLGKIMVRNLREVRLWDTSDVNWGMNPATIASKAAIPYRDTGKAPEDEDWSAPNLGDFTDDNWDDLSTGEKRRIAAHYAFTVNDPPESFGDLKLPHHRAAMSGVGPAVWRGVAAAMGALLGARGGVDIPSGDREAVYRHLSRHYADFDKEPPDLKMIQLAYAIRDVKEGRVLSSRNLDRLKQALETLNEILLAAEPLDDDEKVKALTENVLARLAIAERDPILFEVR